MSNRERYTYTYINSEGKLCMVPHRRWMVRGIASRCGTFTARCNRLNRSTRYNAPITA